MKNTTTNPTALIATLAVLGAIIQDAFHYARAAAGLDSAFDIGRGTSPRTRIEAFRLALKASREAGLDIIGLDLVRGPVSDRAARLQERVRTQAAARGIDANSGEPIDPPPPAPETVPAICCACGDTFQADLDAPECPACGSSVLRSLDLGQAPGGETETCAPAGLRFRGMICLAKKANPDPWTVAQALGTPWEAFMADREKVATDLIDRAYQRIVDRTDGPLTAYVMIARAVDLARLPHFAPVKRGTLGSYDCDPVSNALDRALRDQGAVRVEADQVLAPSLERA